MSNVDLLMQNARLRDEIEPYMDESVYLVDLDRMTVDNENEFLNSLLAWERAPVLPIANWFDPELVLPVHSELDDDQLSIQLHQVIGRLYEKKVQLNDTFLRWQCIDIVEDEESWLRFYATDVERDTWHFETGLRLPPTEQPPFKRRLPQDL